MRRRSAVAPVAALCWALAASAGCAQPMDPSPAERRRPAAGELPLPSPAAVRGLEVRLALVPLTVARDVEAQAVARFAAYLERRSGLRIRTVLTDSYEETERVVLSGAVDAALLSPLLYVHLTESFASDPALAGRRLRLLATAVAAGSPTYLGYLVVPADSAIRDPADLAGHPVGLVSGSTSGFLYPLDLLDARGLDPARQFAGAIRFDRHRDLLEELLRPPGVRRVEAGALYHHAVDSQPREVRERLRVIAKTARIPRDALVAVVPAPEGVEDGARRAAAAALQHALLGLAGDAEASRAMREGIGYDGWILGDDRRYDAIRVVAERFGHYRIGAGDPDGGGEGVGVGEETRR